MPTIIPREKWGAKPAESVTRSDPAKLKGVVVHWFGKPKAARSHDRCPALLRSVQRTHMAGEFNDIAYSHAVCPHGVIYELRGFDRQTGANGTRKANREYAAVVYMAGGGDKLTARGKVGLRRVVAEWRKRGAGRAVLPHGHFTGSECPGPEVRAWLDARGYEPPRVKPKKAKVVGEAQPKITILTNSSATATTDTFRVHITAGNVRLENQRLDNPAVQKRLPKLLRRFGEVVFRLPEKKS